MDKKKTLEGRYLEGCTPIKLRNRNRKTIAKIHTNIFLLEVLHHLQQLGEVNISVWKIKNIISV